MRMFSAELETVVSLFTGDDTPLGLLKAKGLCATLRVCPAPAPPPPHLHPCSNMLAPAWQDVCAVPMPASHAAPLLPGAGSHGAKSSDTSSRSSSERIKLSELEPPDPMSLELPEHIRADEQSGCVISLARITPPQRYKRVRWFDRLQFGSFAWV